LEEFAGSARFCGRHPQRRAAAVCVRCGEGLCRECLAVGEAGALCPRCRGEEGADAAVPVPWDRAAPARISPSPAAPSGSCAFHAERRASLKCSFCSTPLCEQCAASFDGRTLCPDCLALASPGGRGGRPPSTRERFRLGAAAGGNGPAAGLVDWSAWPGVAFLPLPLILMVFITYLVNQGEGVSWGTAALLLSLLLYGGLLAFVALQVGSRPGAAAALGIRRKGAASAVGAGLLVGAVGFGLNFALLSLATRLMEGWGWLDRWLRGLMEINAGNVPGRWDLAVTVLVVLVLAPACEEIFFRGYLYGSMRNRLGVPASVSLNALLFSLVHFSLYGLPGRMALGVLLCLLYEHTENLAAPLTAHALNNLLALLVPLLSG